MSWQEILRKSNGLRGPCLRAWSSKGQLYATDREAFHSTRDTFERDIIIGRVLSFSPVVIFVV